ncbi:hypothetical protein [Methanolapillus ohkumae]|uniref:Uncharacterized protein n=1 Tax=Methanolapillus ohkumae TaxID=3028298 RepID=A0AA96ZX31_9EURY|nr:hypothetical protein MsAm2_03740 [Methanosarcinaceae archaeon Am2]
MVEEKYKAKEMYRPDGSKEEYLQFIQYFYDRPEDGKFKFTYCSGGEGSRDKKNALKKQSIREDWNYGNLETMKFIPKN